MDDGSGLSSNPEELQTVIEEVEARVLSLQGSIAQEEAKMEGYGVSMQSHSHPALYLHAWRM